MPDLLDVNRPRRAEAGVRSAQTIASRDVRVISKGEVDPPDDDRRQLFDETSARASRRWLASGSDRAAWRRDRQDDDGPSLLEQLPNDCAAEELPPPRRPNLHACLRRELSGRWSPAELAGRQAPATGATA